MTELLHKLDQLCRLCLSEDGKVPIFPDETKEADLSERIFQCVSILVRKDGRFPSNVCSSCFSLVDSWFTFKEKCHLTQRTLCSMVGVDLKELETILPQETVDGGAACNGNTSVYASQNVADLEKNDDCHEITKTALNSVGKRNEPENLVGDVNEEAVENAKAQSANVEKACSAQSANSAGILCDDVGENNLSMVIESVQSCQMGIGSRKEIDVLVQDDDEDDEEEEESEEPPTDEVVSSNQLVNPKFPTKLTDENMDSVNNDETNAGKASSEKGAAPSTSFGCIDLCDDDVTVIEPDIPSICLDDELVSSQKKPEETSSFDTDDPPSGSVESARAKLIQNENLSIRIESAVTLPAIGDLFGKNTADALDKQIRDENESWEAEKAGQGSSARSSRENSLDRGSVPEEQQFEIENRTDETSQENRPQENENKRTTPDSTMVSSSIEEAEPYIPVSWENIKTETNRGYADEDVTVYGNMSSNTTNVLGTKTRDEFEREKLAGDKTVDVDNARCIICDHRFHSLSSLLRHTKCKTHIINRSITMKRESGAPIDSTILAQHNRQMWAYKNQWKIAKKKNFPTLGGPNDRKFTCKSCGVSVTSARDLERHKQSLKHKLCVLTGGPPTEEPLPEKRRIIKPQHLQYDREEPPQHLPKLGAQAFRQRMSVPQNKPEREYICPIPNCNYICYQGSVLLTHMTSHGIQGQTPLPPPVIQPSVSQISPQTPNRNIVRSQPSSRSKKYENLYCQYHDNHFESARGYLNHIRFCNMALPISNFLVKNAGKEDSPKRYCKLCDLSFSSFDMLVQHLQVYHKGSSDQQEQEGTEVKVAATSFAQKVLPQARYNRKHKCHICGKVFNLYHSLKSHLRTHQMPAFTSHSCKVCKKTFSTRKACNSHLKNHFLPPGSNKLFCSACFKNFDSRQEIARHRFDGTCHAQLPPAAPGSSFSCDQCSLSFKDEKILHNHKLRFHPEIKKEKTEDEEMDSSSSKVEAQLYETHSTLPPNTTVPISYVNEPTECMLCGKKFSCFSNVKRHCRFVHRMQDNVIMKMVANFTSGSGDFTSEQSDPSAMQQKPHNSEERQHQDESELNQGDAEGFCRHCGVQTNGEPCPNCNASDSNEQSGSSELLFKCPIGHMSFNDENAMLKHYSYCTGKCGPYFECGTCGYEFRYRKSFDAHNCAQRRKPSYDCTDCHRSFSKKSYLMNHEMKCPNMSSQGPFTDSQVTPSSTQPTPTSQVKKTRQSGPITDEELAQITGEERPKPTEVFPCSDCEKIFHSVKALNGHGWVHKSSTAKNPMLCKFCGRENLILSNLYGHAYKCVKSLFMTEEVLTCDDCSTFLSRYDSPKELSAKLHSHVLNCYPIPWFKNEGEGVGAEKLLCYICCYAFSSVESLTIHKSQHKKRSRRNSPFLKSPAKKRPRPSQNYSVPNVEFDLNDMIEEEIFESEDSCASASTSSTSATKFILHCSVCNRQFHNIDKLRNHEKVHGIVRKVVSEDDKNDEPQPNNQNVG